MQIPPMRRVVPILALLGLGLWLAIAGIEGHGPFANAASRHLRAMKDRTGPPPACQEQTFASIAALPANRPLAEFAPLENQGASVVGYVRSLEHARDGDLHLAFVAEPQRGRGRGHGYWSAEITPVWRQGSATWTFERLAEAFGLDRSGRSTAAVRLQRVRLSGWLLYDYLYDALPAWVFDRADRVTGWEIHPVTRIELWDEGRQAFVELPR